MKKIRIAIVIIIMLSMFLPIENDKSLLITKVFSRESLVTFATSLIALIIMPIMEILHGSILVAIKTAWQFLLIINWFLVIPSLIIWNLALLVSHRSVLKSIYQIYLIFALILSIVFSITQFTFPPQELIGIIIPSICFVSIGLEYFLLKDNKKGELPTGPDRTN
jgi:hypothetical protein